VIANGVHWGGSSTGNREVPASTRTRRGDRRLRAHLQDRLPLVSDENEDNDDLSDSSNG
jgi:hypothetical protein